ncbi:natterin-3-like [Betta splendens]|uniref:Natterin-3-like n=1 Tax=Betta splendens TaxID=158456 RepID=A0A6P7NKH2_BETSP|nr:natterin-3-like [Betta splendens]
MMLIHSSSAAGARLGFKMKLLVLLLLALPALPLDSSKNETKLIRRMKPSLGNIVPSGPVQLNKRGGSHSLNMDQTNLKWETWKGSLPNGAVSIYNKYVGHTDYVCKHGCNAGFYRPQKGPYCHYSHKKVGHQTSQFEILVNKQNIEFLEWEDASHGSVPQHSVITCAGRNAVYVGKNKYGLGKVVPLGKAFYLPWKKTEYWYYHYQVLTFSNDVVSEDISDVKYKMNQAKIYTFPPKTIDTSSISNNQCQLVSKTVTLTTTTQVSQKWDHSFSLQMGVKKTFTAGIPTIASGQIELSMQVSYQFTTGTTHTESNSHSVSIKYDVPPNNLCTVKMVGRKSEVTVPYTARLRRTYRNGETREASFTGTYKGVQFGQVEALAGRCVPNTGAKPCPGAG